MRARREHASRWIANVSQQYQALLDQSTPYVMNRWIGTGVTLMLFFIRIFVAQGWYIGTRFSVPNSTFAASLLTAILFQSPMRSASTC